MNKRTRARKSFVWGHVIEEEDKGKVRVICSYCDWKCKKTGSTSNIAYHLKMSHSDKLVPATKTQMDIGVMLVTSQPQIAAKKQEMIDKYVVRFIATDNVPLVAVEKLGFIQLMEHLVPSYASPSANKVKAMLGEQYEERLQLVWISLPSVNCLSYRG